MRRPRLGILAASVCGLLALWCLAAIMPSPALAAGEDGSIKWQCQIINGAANINDPALGPDGTIYVTSGATLNAVNPAGSLLWQQTEGAAVNAQVAIGRDGTIYLGSAARVYLSSYPTHFYQHSYLNAFSPNPLLKWQWEYPLPVPPVPQDFKNYYAAAPVNNSPAIGPDGTVYVSLGPGWSEIDSYTITAEISGGLLAFTPGGSWKWSQLVSRANHSVTSTVVTPPVIGRDGTIYLCVIEDDIGYVRAYSPSGGQKWQRQVDVGPGFAGTFVYPPAIGGDGTIYVPSGSTGYAGSVTPDANLWAINPDGTQKWKHHFPGNQGTYVIPGSPVIARDGTIYLILSWGGNSSSSNLIALNPGDGSQKWAYQYPIYMNFGSWAAAPALGRDGTIFWAADLGAAVAVLRAINPDGSQKWECQLGPFGLYVNGISSPTIGPDGTVYVGCADGYLYAVNTSCGGLAKAPWPMIQHDPGHTGLGPAAPVNSWFNLLLAD